MKPRLNKSPTLVFGFQTIAFMKKQIAASKKIRSFQDMPMFKFSMPTGYSMKWALAIAVVFFVSFFVSLYVSEMGDFPVFYQAAGTGSPYEVGGFLNPAWTHAIIFPLRFLPQQVAYATWMAVSMVIVVIAIHRLGGDKLSYVLVFANPFFLTFVTKGNTEALVLLGLVIEARPFGVLLLLTKPQMGWTAAAYKLLEYRWKDWLVLVVAVGITFVVWGNWPVDMLGNWLTGLTAAEASLDVWPLGVLAGIVLLYLAYKEKSLPAVFLAGYLLTPYISHNSLFVYTVVIFSSFQKGNRIVVSCCLYLFFAVALFTA